MFEKHLLEARLRSRKQSLKLFLAFIVLIILSSVFLIMYPSCCGLSSGADSMTAIESDEISDPDPIQLKNSDHDQSQADLRQAYLTAFNAYENDIKPKLEPLDLKKWDSSAAARLASLEEEALIAFSDQDYKKALENIEQASNLSEALFIESQQQFDDALSKASVYYSEDSYEKAKQEIERALMLNARSEEAIKLEKQIDILNQLLPLLEKVRVAQIENDTRKELNLLEAILKLDPDRKEARERKQHLVKRNRNEQYKSYIDQSWQSLKSGDAYNARLSLSKALAINPDGVEIQDISNSLKILESELRFEAYTETASKAMAADDWILAKQNLRQALAEKPDEKNLKALLSKSERIIYLKQEIDRYVAKPYRLVNTQVLTKAKALLADAENFHEASPALMDKSNDLSRLIDQVNRKIPVEVISDNNTNILVRGVGVVGQTESKTIELPPGRYQFEGKRAGYKSKLIDVLIPYDRSEFQVLVICDEPI
jgi:hypothetical protein